MEILKVKQENFDKIIKKAIAYIKQGKVMVLPTDTVYGLVAVATNKKAVERLFKIKKRKKEKPIPIFVRNIKMAKKFALIDKKQEKFLGKVWPGKITIVLKRTRLRQGFGGRGKIYGIDKKTIALRTPKYKLINILLKKLNRPLTGTSANISGKPASTKIKEVLRQLKKQKYKPDLIIDAGNLPKNRPSTVIDLTGKKPKILRK
jgi:L-threonylcarbamoyladenylate synthase